MSQEQVEVVRRVIDAFNRRDLDAAGRYNDDGVEVDWSRSRGVEAGIYRGREAVRGFWNTFFEMFVRVTVSPDEFIECGEHIVMPNRTHFCGRDGVEVEAHSVVVVTFHNGRIVQWRLYQERAEALQGIGLSEQDAHADS
jgi:ketosteroid isomerase-like protein